MGGVVRECVRLSLSERKELRGTPRSNLGIYRPWQVCTDHVFIHV